MSHLLRLLIVAIAWGVFVSFAQCSDSQPGGAESKSSGLRERFRFEVWKVGPFQRRPVIQDFVVVNEPFKIRAEAGAMATGLLRRTTEGDLHFKGEISHSGMSAVFNNSEKVERGFFSLNPKGGPDAKGFQWIEVIFSLSHVKEIIPAGLGLGVSGERDELIVVAGPKPEKQRSSEWFDLRRKAKNVLTPDQETWLLFRSKQLKSNLLRIDRIERTKNTFTVTMNVREALGNGHHELHGINLGELATGTYEVEWIIGSGKRGEFPKVRNPTEPVKLKSSFNVLKK